MKTKKNKVGAPRQLRDGKNVSFRLSAEDRRIIANTQKTRGLSTKSEALRLMIAEFVGREVSK